MAKADSKQKNVRLRNDVWFAVEDLQVRLGCSRDGVLERAVEFFEVHNGGQERVVVSNLPPNGALGMMGAAAIPGIQVGTSSLPKNAKCGHCGQRFAGPRSATICRACEDGGHRGDMRECQECIDARGSSI